MKLISSRSCLLDDYKIQWCLMQKLLPRRSRIVSSTSFIVMARWVDRSVALDFKSPKSRILISMREHRSAKQLVFLVVCRSRWKETEYFRVHFSLGLSSTISSASNPAITKIKVVVGDDSSGHSSTASGIAQSIHININTTTSYDDEPQENCHYDTIDALPHVDHYRNLFSITSPEPKSRPTLEALHETTRLRLGSTIDLHSEMISMAPTHLEPLAQVEVKPKVDIVKFGWIIGVLVRWIDLSSETLAYALLVRLDSMCLEYLWCDAFSSFVLGDWTSRYRPGPCHCAYLHGRNSNHCCIHECDMYQRRSERWWNVLLDFT